ncbi:1,4-dihydroxy-2-naphthoyl-CoA hydrolase [filamentous cyanobacterium CCP1]|nr:1,4-dihydroxy-2-naphthoyl-CoA hydrolase [filamentous cyanobacterium CCP2]PSB60054.1 1,4-dihydroxy-2-naphthoyl-CoA hydrolase [filamentous cyanobacterium CCP1]
MPFTYHRTIYFHDTDAAGVVYFANVLSMCHEAYEAALAASGINLKEFFSGQSSALPIVHAEIDFSKPMFCGEQYAIQVLPSQLTDSKFQIAYQVFSLENPEYQASAATTIHVCINTATRTRTPLPCEVLQWLERSL